MTDRPTRYPLAWPHGWPRDQGRRKAARFYSATQYHGVGTSYMKSGKVTISDALDRLERELARLGVNDSEVIVSTNLVLGSRGAPLSNQAEPRDPGAAVYFSLKGKDRVLACDRWDRTADNLAAIAAHIDAIRRVDRYGVGTLDQAFAGYDALPPPGADNRPPWRKVLGFLDGQLVTAADIEIHFRDRAKQHHPGLGGSQEAMAQLNEARDAALREPGRGVG
jgi:hypothetical protein